jgi:hypothetical protein
MAAQSIFLRGPQLRPDPVGESMDRRIPFRRGACEELEHVLRHCQVNLCRAKRARSRSRITLLRPHFAIGSQPRLGRSGASIAKRDCVEG